MSRVSHFEVGHDSGRGNLLAVHPDLLAADFRTEIGLRRKLETVLSEARSRGLLSGKTIAVFPEMIGLYLLAEGEPAAVFEVSTLAEVVALVLREHASDIQPPQLTVGAADRATRALFERKAPRMAATYQSVFGGLARAFGITVAAGSIVLPGPFVRAGRLEVRIDRPAQNVAAVFAPNGEIHPDLAVKSFPTHEEEAGLGITRGRPESLPVFRTPVGVLGVLVCADSWFPAAYRSVEGQGAQILAIVSHAGDSQVMGRPWPGYSLGEGIAAPEDVDPADAGRLTEGEAWEKYALPGRLAERESSIVCAVAVFLRGRLWEHATPGAWPLAVRNGRTEQFPRDRAVP